MITLINEGREYRFSQTKKLSSNIKKSIHKYAISLFINNQSFMVCYVNDKHRAASAMLSLIRAFTPASRKLIDKMSVVLATKHETIFDYELPITDNITASIDDFIKYN